MWYHFLPGSFGEDVEAVGADEPALRRPRKATQLGGGWLQDRHQVAARTAKRPREATV